MSGSDKWRGAVEAVRRAETARGRAAGGRFSLEGVRLHERALRAGWRVETAVVSDSFYTSTAERTQRLLHDLEIAGCKLVTIPDGVMAELTDGRELGAIIGLIPLPELPALSEVLPVDGTSRAVILVAAGVTDPGNMGALMRTALAGGAAAFLACNSCDPFHPKALRTSMGSLFKLPLMRYEDCSAALGALAGRGFTTLGLAVDGSVSLVDINFGRGRWAIIVGSEAHGLSQELRSGLDFEASIPMRRGVDSYSVNAAAAIALHEFGRDR